MNDELKAWFDMGGKLLVNSCAVAYFLIGTIRSWTHEPWEPSVLFLQCLCLLLFVQVLCPEKEERDDENTAG